MHRASAFDRFYDQTETLIHPMHQLMFQTYLPYINCCGAVQDFKAKLVPPFRQFMPMIDLFLTMVWVIHRSIRVWARSARPLCFPTTSWPRCETCFA